MRDVAGTAGVSPKTVSRVVNREAGVRADTAARVEAAIARLGFARNDVARSLRHGRASALGLVIEDLANPSAPRSPARSRTPPTPTATSSSRARATRIPSANAGSSCGSCAARSTPC